MDKPKFTVTEVRDWINGIIADYRQLVKGELPDSSDLTYDGLGNIEMLEYIRDNYVPIEMSPAGVNIEIEEEGPSQNAIDYAKRKAQGYDTVKEKEEDV